MTKTKTINSATRRLTVISALLLFLVLAVNASVQAQLQTVPIASRIALAAQRTTGQAPRGVRSTSVRPRAIRATLFIARHSGSPKRSAPPGSGAKQRPCV